MFPIDIPYLYSLFIFPIWAGSCIFILFIFCIPGPAWGRMRGFVRSRNGAVNMDFPSLQISANLRNTCWSFHWGNTTFSANQKNKQRLRRKM